ncbi:MAG: SUMF1/EgtB/PvdO family nonheme iron enzyme [Ruminococcus sp.]|nr:SUMF1/EgtB/PvdO family nonheme iron enzyme [Ruminococcus sp.]
MGSPESEPERSSDEVQHNVTVGDFYISKTEISQKEYQEIMGTNPSDTQGDDLPVTNVTWYDAIEYCNKLSEKEGLTPCYTIAGTDVTWDKSADGYRLPTEAEWEFSARAGTDTPFNFGDYVHNSDANCYNAYGYNNDASGNWVNGSDAYLRKTVSVNQYPASSYGLYNMHGNVAEWVWDWYGEYDTETVNNPTGSETGNAKVVRGGGWNDHPKHIRSAYRGTQPADIGLYGIGIRPVRNAGKSLTGKVKSEYSAEAVKKTGKTLIVYFSQTGNTEGLAEIIHEMSGADIVRLERKTPYSSSSNGPVLYGEALDELRAEAIPELKEYPDIENYDTILLGYCNWWSSIPAPVRSFLIHEDFSGKTIIPFCSMGGGRFGQTISAIAKLTPESVMKEGLEVTYSSYDRDEIENWLKKNNINN